jgi:putative FmdB family regulatory protein
MPIYEYECTTCGIHFERLQHFGDAPPLHCPRGHNGVRKVLSPPLIIFKGSGFYSTDNRSKGNGKDGESTSDKKWESATEKGK